VGDDMIGRVVFFIIFVNILNIFAEVRVKDIAHIEGVGELQVVGYGLVVGLNGTGDKNRTIFTVQSISKMLQRMGVAIDANKARVKNVAAVMVTGKINPFMKKGTKFDVQVASLGDATSLEGGVLIMTPLRGPDNIIYAAASGPVSIGGMNSGAPRGSRQNFELVGMVPQGAILENEIKTNIVENDFLNITLNEPDFTTIMRLKQAVDERFGNEIAFPVDAGLVRIKIPANYSSQYKVIELISIIENLTIIPDDVAKVVINERTGTIISGKNVGISTVSISHNDISIVVDQGDGQGGGATQARTIVLPERVNVQELAKALNAIGATPRDLIAIFQALKKAGALNADLEVM